MVVNFKHLVIVIFFLASCTKSDEASFSFSDWDNDQDKLLDNNEFDSFFTESPYFDRFNKNTDDGIDENEFYQEFIAMIDHDDNGQIGPTEWEEVFKTYFSTDKINKETALKEWDKNHDNTLTNNELVSSLKEENYFGNWDQDGNGTVSEKEFAKASFNNWDTDGDGFVQAEEYTDWYNKYQQGN